MTLTEPYNLRVKNEAPCAAGSRQSQLQMPGQRNCMNHQIVQKWMENAPQGEKVVRKDDRHRVLIEWMPHV